MNRLIVLTLTLMFASCATTKFDKKEISQVKKVAIVGHLVTQTHLKDTEDVKNDVKEGLISGLLYMAGIGGGEEEDQMMHEPNPAKVSAHSQAVYDSFVKQLQKNSKWKVVAESEYANNSEYKTIKQEMENKFAMVNSQGKKDMRRFKTTNNFHPNTIIGMNHEQRQKLIKALNVDAIASIDYEVNLTRETITSSNVEAKSTAKLYLFKRGKEEAIITKSYEGKPLVNGKAKVGFIGFADDKKDINNLIINSTFSSNDQIIKDITTL